MKNVYIGAYIFSDIIEVINKKSHIVYVTNHTNNMLMNLKRSLYNGTVSVYNGTCNGI